MPKAYLKFSLPDEEEDFNAALNVDKMANVIWEMDQWLRGEVKYGQDEIRQKILQEARDMLRELASDLPSSILG